MQIIKELNGLRLGWYDDDQTILMLEVSNYWTWTEAEILVSTINETILATEKKIYTIYLFSPEYNVVPRGKGGFGSLRRMMRVDPPNEQLLILVGSNLFLKRLIEIVSEIGLRAAFDKYRFVVSLDEAIAAIAEHQGISLKV